MSIKEKFVNSKPVQAFAHSKFVSKAVEVGGAVAGSVCTLMISASAADAGSTLTSAAGVEKLLSTAESYVEPMIYITCGVAGIKLVQRIIKGATR